MAMPTPLLVLLLCAAFLARGHAQAASDAAAYGETPIQSEADAMQSPARRVSGEDLPKAPGGKQPKRRRRKKSWFAALLGSSDKATGSG